jgi:hypothetical protein
LKKQGWVDLNLSQKERHSHPQRQRSREFCGLDVCQIGGGQGMQLASRQELPVDVLVKG